MQAFRLNNDSDAELVDFLDGIGESREFVLGYHYPFYRDALVEYKIAEAFYVGVRNTANKLIAVLPGFIKKGEGNIVYSSMPFFGPNGGIICNEEIEKEGDLYDVVLSFLEKHLLDNNIIASSFYSGFNHEKSRAEYKKRISDAFEIKKFTSFIELQNFELASSFVDSSAARNYKKAVKSGVTVRTTVQTSDIPVIYEIYRQNCVDYGIPLKPYEVVNFLLSDQRASGHVDTYIAEFEGKIIGALITISSPLTVSYYIPCNLHAYRNLQPNALLIVSAITSSKNKGKLYWNWESSPSRDSGVYQFKKKWGSQDSEYSIFVKRYKSDDFFLHLGEEEIRRQYPYFFVYPFHMLQK